MNTQRPTVEQLCKWLEQSLDFMRFATTGFNERNERVVYRRPVTNDQGQMEFANLVDNTLASYIEKMPKNIIQKLPSFTIDAHTQNKAEDLVYEYIANKIILRTGSSDGYSLLQKYWMAMRNAAAFGACAAYLPFVSDHGEYSVGFEPLYWGDLFPEAYAKDLNSANFITFRTLKTERDIQNIIAGLDDEKGQGTWSRQGLQTVLDAGVGETTGHDGGTRNTKASMNGLPDGMYELFVYTDTDWIITFHYASQTILRVVPNISRRKRVVSLYSDYDGMSIMGRSLVDLAYAPHLALTSLTREALQVISYNTKPAKFVKGVSLDESRFNLEKDNTMFLHDEDGEMQLLPVDTSAVQNFPALYNLMKTILLTSLPSSNENGISAEVGDPTYSRTQAGVNQQANKADIENNYYRKNFEQFFEMVLENQINIYIAEVKYVMAQNDAIPTLTLDDEYANLVREENPAFVNSENKVRLDFADVKGVNVSVDFETTRQMAKEEDLKRLNTFMTGFFEVAKSDEKMAQVMRAAIPLLMEEMARNSNLENSGKIVEAMRQQIEAINQQEQEQQALQMQQQAQAGEVQNV